MEYASERLQRKRGSTVEQLRSDIDHGLTGDKPEGSDPAAVPLGVDEEAAGTPLPASVIDAVRQEERRRGRHASREKRGLGVALPLDIWSSWHGPDVLRKSLSGRYFNVPKETKFGDQWSKS